MIEIKYNELDSKIVIENFAFDVPKKVEGEWSMENYFNLEILLNRISNSEIFLRHMMGKYHCVEGLVSLVMFLLPELVEFYHNEFYSKDKVKSDVHKILAEIQMLAMYKS